MADDYAVARRRAHREKTALPALEDRLPEWEKLKEEPLGVSEVPMYLVRGTVTRSRSSSFSGGFLPLLSPDSEFAGKWKRLLEHQENEGISDPVLVYEYLGEFYVVEGNKRVSVLKYLEQPELTADVIRLLPKGLSAKEKARYEEFRKFNRSTGLFEPYLSREGNYPMLAELMGETVDRPWPEEKVRTLDSAMYHFRKNIDELDLDVEEKRFGDIFLHYVFLYKAESLIDDPERKVRFRIRKIARRYKKKSKFAR